MYWIFYAMKKFIINWLREKEWDYLKIENEESVQKIYNLLLNDFIFDPQNEVEMIYLATYHCTNKKYDLVEKYYLMAIDCGNVDAMTCLGYFYEHIKENYELAEKYYLMANKNETTTLMNNLAEFYYNIKKYDLAEEYYKITAGRGIVDSMYALGVFYKIIKIDFKLSEKYFLMAVDNGHAESMYLLATLYNDVQKYDLAEQYFKIAIDKGIVESMVSLGNFYKNVKEDSELAEKYLKIASESGNVVAINNLAGFYYSEKKYDLAEKYLKMAVEKGSAEAMHCLGCFHYNITQDHSQIEKYYLMAINLNHIDSLKNLSKFYENLDFDYRNKLLDLYYKYISLDNTFCDKLNNKISQNNNFFELFKYKDCLNKVNRKKLNELLIFIDEQKHIISQEIFDFICINCNDFKKCVPYNCGHFQCLNCFKNNIECRLCSSDL